MSGGRAGGEQPGSLVHLPPLSQGAGLAWPGGGEKLGIPYVVAEASYAPKQAGGRWDLGHRAVAEAIRHAALVLQLNPADAECVAAAA